MRKTLPYLGASLSALALLWSTGARAQETFKDVKPDHWAYQSVDDLQKKGILVGYPDGFFKGNRTLTRYEFAVALKRALEKIGAGTKGADGTPGTPGTPGTNGTNGTNGTDGKDGAPGMTPDDVKKLIALTDMFQAELKDLGMNMKTVTSKLDALAKDVDGIKDALHRMIKINGDFFFGARSDRSRFGFNDYSGAGRAANNSHFTNVSTPHDFHLEAHANLPGGVVFTGDLVTSNYISYRGDTFSAGAFAAPNLGLDSITTLYEANLRIPIGYFGTNTQLTIGRFRNQVTPLTMYRPDLDAYFDLPWYDDGSYIQDGVKLTSKFGSIGASAWAATSSSVVDHTGVNFNAPIVGASFGPRSLSPMKPSGLAFRGQVAAAQTAGLHVNIPLFKVGELGLTLIDYSTSGSGVVGLGGAAFGNVVVYGANFKINPIGRFKISGEAAKSATQVSFDTGDGLSNEDNNAFMVNVAYASGPISASAGYQYIDPRFGAPGYWNKIGNWYNPTNIQGPYARVGYQLTKKLSANLGFDFYEGARNRSVATLLGNGGFTVGSSIARASAGVKYMVSKALTVGADYEGVSYDLSSAASATLARSKPNEQYITFHADTALAGNTVLKFAYQMAGARDVGGGFTGNSGAAINYSVFTTQVAVHF